MNSFADSWLCCPYDLGGELLAEGEAKRCPTCGRRYPMRDGVQVIATPAEAKGNQATDTVEQFGESWRLHGHMAEYHRQQFLDWIAPLTAADFRGKDVLEAGCGKGRHSRLLASWDPRTLFAVDLSPAVFQAAANTREFPAARFIQADLLHLPFRGDQFDRVVCIGVLHHLADPQAGLTMLWNVLKPGGALCLWVYAAEGNAWIAWLISPLRKSVTSRIPTRWLRPLTWPLSAVLFLTLKLFYRRPALARRLPYNTYLQRIAGFPFVEIEHIVLDHLCPPIAHYLPRETLAAWFKQLQPKEISFRWHNRNSWAVSAVK